MMEIADPAALGFDPVRLARIGAFLDETYVAPGHLPHADVLIARDGQPQAKCKGALWSYCVTQRAAKAVVS